MGKWPPCCSSAVLLVRIVVIAALRLCSTGLVGAAIPVGAQYRRVDRQYRGLVRAEALCFTMLIRAVCWSTLHG